MKKKSRKKLKNPYLIPRGFEQGAYINLPSVPKGEINIEEIPRNEQKAFNLGDLIGNRDIYKKVLLKIINENNINDLLNMIIEYHVISEGDDLEEILEDGYNHGRIEAIKRVIKWKFNLGRIEDEYYNVSDRIENDFD